VTPGDARRILLLHSIGDPTGVDPKWETGFIGMLRPYHGLREENFHEVMACLRALRSVIARESLDRGLVDAVWTLCHLSRAWGLDPDGMLQRNKLMAPEDVRKLQSWIDTISWTVFWLLQPDGATNEAFAEYDRRFRR
jgi:hypothetical protein